MVGVEVLLNAQQFFLQCEYILACGGGGGGSEAYNFMSTGQCLCFLLRPGLRIAVIYNVFRLHLQVSLIKSSYRKRDVYNMLKIKICFAEYILETSSWNIYTVLIVHSIIWICWNYWNAWPLCALPAKQMPHTCTIVTFYFLKALSIKCHMTSTCKNRGSLIVGVYNYWISLSRQLLHWDSLSISNCTSKNNHFSR